MKFSVLLATVIYISHPTIAYGDAAQEWKASATIVARSLKITDGVVSGTLVVSSSPKQPDLSAKLVHHSNPLLLSTRAKPINLYILVDTSAAAQKRGIQKYAEQLMAQLPRLLSRDSVVSVAAYNSQGTSVLTQHTAPGKIGSLTFASGEPQVSTGYERPLMMLLKTKTVVALPSVVWVLSSGNITLSPLAYTELRKRGIYTHVFLVNPILADSLQSVVARSKRELGASAYRMSVLDVTSDPLLIPEQWYSAKLSPLLLAPEGKVNLQFSAKFGDETIISQPVPTDFTTANQYGIFTSITWIAVLVLLASILGYGSFRIYRYYRQLDCPRCKKPKLSQASPCLFCEDGAHAFLIGKTRYSKALRNLDDVIPITNDRSELSGHRSSLVRILRPPKVTAAKYGAIEASHLSGHPSAFRLVPLTPNDPVMKLNGKLLRAARFLKHGDEIEIFSTKLLFVARGVRQ